MRVPVNLNAPQADHLQRQPMTSALPAAEKMQAYIATARRRRQQQRQTHLHQRRRQGLELAKTAAHILQEEFGVSRVVLFGSALSATHFHETSDLDLAVLDLPPADTIKSGFTLIPQ
jgi:predicted nucleotidyltransferase